MKINKDKQGKFWEAIRKSASLVRNAPVYTQAGLVLSDNFNGSHTEQKVNIDVYKQSEPSEADLLFAKEYDPSDPNADYIELAHSVAGYREQCEALARAAERRECLLEAAEASARNVKWAKEAMKDKLIEALNHQLLNELSRGGITSLAKANQFVDTIKELLDDEGL